MNPLDEHLKKQFEDLEIRPSAHLWKEKIAPQLNAAPRKSKALLLYRSAAVVLLLLAGLAVVQYFGQNSAGTDALPEMPVVWENVPPSPVEEKEPAGDTSLSTEQVLPQNKAVKNHAVAQKTAIEKTENPEAPNSTTVHHDMATADPVREEPILQIPVEKEEPVLAYEFQTELPTDSSARGEAAPASIKDYAVQQWQNITSRQKLEAPPKEILPIPQIAVRIEGNPLRKMIPGK